MASSLTISSSDRLLNLLYASFKSGFPPVTTADTPQSSLSLPSGAVQGSNTIASYLSPSIYPHISYSELEKAEVNQWLTLSARLTSPKTDSTSTNETLQTLNEHLSTRTTILGSKPSVADAALYARLAPLVAKWTAEERTGKDGYHNIVRYIDFVQNAPLFSLTVADADKVQISLDDIKYAHKPIDPREEKERKKKEKAAQGRAQAQPSAPDTTEKVKTVVPGVASSAKEAVSLPTREKKEKKEKKEKAPKPAKQPPKETPLSPSLIDLRVGHILKAVNHPNADSLYVSTIACGDPAGSDNTSEFEGQVVRTVCSGLNGLVPLEEMQGRKVVVVCNLKPVTMRGVKSAAMVLACSPRAGPEGDGHKGPVELVIPPADGKAGERVGFEGWEGEPEKLLNPKKKVWETIQPGFTSTESLEVAFAAADVPKIADEVGERKQVARLVTASGGTCTIKSLKGGTVR
ncbi:MAG: G4 quadruplex nucleic acid binding protein [Vezdaea aestivalis]|nr:MAG: G4 quadruplex nucleic acid binding protein [Vezdaea aestivalis]